MNLSGGATERRGENPDILQSVTDTPPVYKPSEDSDTPPVSSRDSDRPSELPTVEERVRELLDKYPKKSFVPMSSTHGRRLRKEVTEADTVERTVEPVDPLESSFVVEDVVERRSLPLVAAVEEFLGKYESYRDMSLKFAYGRKGGPDYETFQVPAQNSFQPEYAKAEYAKLQAFARELTGGKRPSGAETEPAFENPAIAFLTRTASGSPDGEYLPFVDHDREIADAWGDGVYKALYDAMDRAGIEAWEYHRQGEPHQGGGTNTLYGHEHTLIVFDLPVGVSLDRVERELRSVIDKHVEVCPSATKQAHKYSKTIEVREVGPHDVGDVAAYMAKYVSFGEADLLEREIEYIAWGATQWSTNTQKATRSVGANEAIRADACRQRYDDPDTYQEREHGERVVRSDKRGASFECLDCGSTWGIDQSPETLSETRLVEVSADGGSEVAGEEGADDESVLAEIAFKQRWPSARSGAITGEPVEGEGVDGIPPPGMIASFDRPPTWQLEAVVKGDDELPPGRGAVELMPLILPDASRPSYVAGVIRAPSTYLECGECGIVFATPGAFVDEHDCDVDVARVVSLLEQPPPLPDDPINVAEIMTPDGEEVRAPIGEESAEIGQLDVEIGSIVERFPTDSVASILGRLQLPPDRFDLVRKSLTSV